MPETLTIGQLAARAGVNVETVRYYQRIGLIEEPPRPAQGYRRYPATVAARIRFVRRAQELGFTLAEIAELLSLDERSCDDARRIAEHKRDLIAQRIADLSAMRAALARLIRACREDRQDRCAIIETLARDGR